MAERKKFAEVEYVDSAGNEVKLYDDNANDATAIKFAFVDFNPEVFAIADLNDRVRHAGLMHGINQKLRDAAAGKTGEDAYDAVMSIWERLVAGDWLKPRELAGPRTSLVFEAVVRVKTMAGQAPDEDEQALIREALKEKEARERALANPRVVAAYEAIKAERAAERARKAAEKAEESGGDGLEGLTF